MLLLLAVLAFYSVVKSDPMEVTRKKKGREKTFVSAIP